MKFACINYCHYASILVTSFACNQVVFFLSTFSTKKFSPIGSLNNTFPFFFFQAYFPLFLFDLTEINSLCSVATILITTALINSNLQLIPHLKAIFRLQTAKHPHRKHHLVPAFRSLEHESPHRQRYDQRRHVTRLLRAHSLHAWHTASCRVH